MLTAAALVVVFCGSAMAKVTGPCSDCHTMHNSQDGNHMIFNTAIDGTGGIGGGGYPALTRGSCVGCHTGENTGRNTTPYVYDTGSVTYGANTLAGGNFKWVITDGDAMGHNVKGIPGMTGDTLGAAPGGDTPSCASITCHESLFEVSYVDTGCQGCHLEPKHHAPQQADGAPALEANGFFRFLSGHFDELGHGVEGIEDADWQFKTTASNHNEYLGKVGTHTNDTNDTIRTSGFWGISENTMTAYCTGCHGKFHTQVDGNSNWIRHPSDAVLPNSGEYMAYTVYDPDVPVARPSLDGGVSNLVTPGTDMVMCLSCHRAHGSPNDDLLRWKYTGDGGCEAQGKSECGCFVCHTQKGTYKKDTLE